MVLPVSPNQVGSHDLLFKVVLDNWPGVEYYGGDFTVIINANVGICNEHIVSNLEWYAPADPNDTSYEIGEPKVFIGPFKFLNQNLDCDVEVKL